MHGFIHNDCIQALFVTGCSMRMSCSDGSWHNYDHGNVITNLPEVDNAMSFLNKNNFIAGPNNLQALMQHGCLDVSQLVLVARQSMITKQQWKDIMQYLVLYQQIRKTTKYLTTKRVNGMILFL